MLLDPFHKIIKELYPTTIIEKDKTVNLNIGFRLTYEQIKLIDKGKYSIILCMAERTPGMSNFKWMS